MIDAKARNKQDIINSTLNKANYNENEIKNNAQRKINRVEKAG